MDPPPLPRGRADGGRGPDAGENASTLSFGRPGVLHGSFSYVLQDDDGQTQDVHSVSAGLDYPGVGPEHSYLKDIGRAKYVGVTDAEALDGFQLLCRTEGIIPALEPSHVIYYVSKLAPTLPKDEIIIVGLKEKSRRYHGLVIGCSWRYLRRS